MVEHIWLSKALACDVNTNANDCDVAHLSSLGQGRESEWWTQRLEAVNLHALGGD